VQTARGENTIPIAKMGTGKWLTGPDGIKLPNRAVP